MQLGMHLHQLWRVRFGVVICAVVALFVSLPATYEVNLLPPSLKPKSLETATASTHVLVDTPRTTLLDLRQGTFTFEAMTNRAVLLGNVMASVPVREYIARRAGVPANIIRATTPATPSDPRPIENPENRKRTQDILRAAGEYRVNISANPSVPILDVYAQAPTADASQQLANASVDGLKDYLADVARVQGVPRAKQVRLQQLGRARGGVINGGVRLEAAFLTFLFAFGLCAGAVLFVSRVRRGWRLADQIDRDARESAAAADGAPQPFAGTSRQRATA
jgi:hypothetical protein